MSKGYEDVRPLYRARGYRCWRGLGLFHNFINRNAAHSQKECVNYLERCESLTTFSASDPSLRDLLFSCGRKSSKEYVARGFQLFVRVAGCRMFRFENGTTTRTIC